MSGRCEVRTYERGVTLNLRRALGTFESVDCTRAAKVTLRYRDGGKLVKCCAVHARMAKDGYVEETGQTMHPLSRSDYQRGRVKGPTPYAGKWEVAA